MGHRAGLPDELLPSQIKSDTGGATEEILSSIIHAVGAGLSIAGLAVLLVLSGRAPSVWKYAGFSIYGVCQILMFFSSAFTHGFSGRPRIRRTLSVIDFSLIYMLIAGTYTPVCMVAMRGRLGWLIFATIWGLAVIGVVLRVVFFDRTRLLANSLYIPMVWFVLLVLRPLVRATSPQFVIWVMSGGAWYSLGFVFYMWRKLRFSHAIWHVFVIGGCVTFTLAFALHLA